MFQGKKILVTGAGGFIGSHLAEELVRKGAEVKAFVHYNSKNDWGWLESSELKAELEVISGDIRDYDSVNAALAGCNGVFHLAALIGIPYSYVSPLAYVRTNVEGTYNVLQASRERELELVAVTSTSETYGTAQELPISEKHPLVGQSPYSASKIAADQLALSYYLSFDLPLKIVRPFNTFGPRQSARAIIPTIITQLLAGKRQIKLGNTTPTRDLVFVKDTVEGFLAIARSDKLKGEVCNIGTGEEISILDLAHTIARLLDVELEITSDEQRVRPDKSEVERLLCDNKKLVEHSDWKRQYSLEQGLELTIDWLKNHQALYKPDVYNV